MAAEEEDPDMSDPTAAYTAVGVGYGNEGAQLKLMYMSSPAGADRKTGYLLEINDIFDAEGGAPKFNGYYPDAPADEVDNRNFRFRYGSLSTKTGIGQMVDVVNKDHAFFGRFTVAQVGALATIPVGDNLLIWPVVLAGGVIVEDNTADVASAAAAGAAQAAGEAAGQEAAAAALAAGATPEEAAAAAAAAGAAAGAAAMEQAQGQYDQLTNLRSSGMSWASTVWSMKVYSRYKFTDSLWALGAYTTTEEMGGKSYSDDVAEGGLQLPKEQLELTLGYQITSTQNLRLNYHHYSSRSDLDRVWLEYNYAF